MERNFTELDLDRNLWFGAIHGCQSQHCNLIVCILKLYCSNTTQWFEIWYDKNDHGVILDKVCDC
jgi:hypothetical protein